MPIDQAPYYKQCDHKLQFIMDQHTSKDTSISQFIQNLKINKKGLITGPYRLNKNFELCTGKLIISGGTTCIQYCVKSKVLHAGNLVSPMNIETLTLTKNPNENEKCKVKYHK